MHVMWYMLNDTSDLCLCISGIPALLTSNIIIETAVGLVGTAAVTAALQTMVLATKSLHE